MKKIVKIFGVLTLLFSLFASLGMNAMNVVEAQTDTATVTLHKKMMDSFPTDIQNTGNEMDEFDVYEDYTDGVEFSVYDVTADFYARRALGDSVDAALAYVQALAPTTAVTSGTTGTDGSLSFTLNKMSGGKNAVYLFIETAKAGVTIAANMVLSFPVYALDDDGEYTDVELNNIHLYPKNVVEAEGSLVVNKKGTANNEALSGAKFIIQNDVGARYLSGVSNGFFTWSADLADAIEFETGFNYTSSVTGVAGIAGVLGISGFSPGTYKLIEVEAPDNAAIIDANKITSFAIAAGQTTATNLTVYNDTIDIDKTINSDFRNFDVGDLIPYIGSVNIPVGIGDKLDDGNYKHPGLIISDVPVTGLMFNNDLTVSINGVAFDITGMLTLTTNGFSLNIPASALEAFAGEDLDLAYNMYLDGSADPDLGYNNTIDVTTELLVDEDDTEDVYTGGKRFVKVDANFDANNTLAGAMFVVRRDSDDKYMVIGTGNAITWVDALADATKVESDANGIVDIRGLAYGDYQLIETDAPTDYVLNTTPLDFEIFLNSYGEPDALVAAQAVVNVRKGRLPSTGGSGILGIVGLGAALISATGGYYIKRRREE